MFPKLAPALFVLLWATGFVGAKFGLPYAEPMTFLSLRFAIAAALLGLWAIAAGEFREGRGDLFGAAVVGVLIHAVYLGGVFTAIWLGTGAAISALVVGLQPIATALLAGAILGDRLTKRQQIGMALGFGGVALAVAPKLDQGEAPVLGLALCFAGLVAISLATILQKRRAVTRGLAADGAVQFAAASVATGAAALAFEDMVIDWTSEFLLALSWMTGVLSIGAISILYALLRRGEASATASLFFLVPGVTALMAWAMFGESFGAVELAGFVAAMIGVKLAGQAPPDAASASR